MASVRDLMAQLNEFLAQQSMMRKVLAGSVLLVVLAFLVVMVVYQGQTERYAVLYSGLDSEQAQQVKDELNLSGEHFRIREEGKGWTVMVPEDKVQTWRLDLATKISATGSDAGWELFDPQSFGTTYAEHKVKKYRALRGELARTISSMEMVKAAKVDLAVPERELFIKDQLLPKAAVLVELYEGEVLDRQQVHTIRSLVAGSVEGLTVENVTVADTMGNELSKPEAVQKVDTARQELDKRERLIGIQETLRKQYEEEMQAKILDALDPIFGPGPGHVRAQVSVEIDHTIKEETSTRYGDPVPRSSADIVRTVGREGKLAIGIGDAARHVEDVEGSQENPGVEGEYVREKILNNEVDITDTRTVYSPYKITRVTAGVVVDDKPVGVSEEGGYIREPLERKELSDLQETVQGIINYYRDRPDGGSDVVKVTNISFAPTLPPTVVQPVVEWYDRMWVKFLILGVLLVLAYILVIRPLLGVMRPRYAPTELTAEDELTALPEEEVARLEAARAAEALEGGPGEEAMLQHPTETQLAAQHEELDDEIMELASNNPKKAAMVLRAWIEPERAARGAVVE